MNKQTIKYLFILAENLKNKQNFRQLLEFYYPNLKNIPFITSSVLQNVVNEYNVICDYHQYTMKQISQISPTGHGQFELLFCYLVDFATLRKASNKNYDVTFKKNKIDIKSVRKNKNKEIYNFRLGSKLKSNINIVLPQLYAMFGRTFGEISSSDINTLRNSINTVFKNNLLFYENIIKIELNNSPIQHLFFSSFNDTNNIKSGKCELYNTNSIVKIDCVTQGLIKLKINVNPTIVTNLIPW